VSIWAWFLVGSAAAGLILVIAGLVQIVTSALRTAHRFGALLDTPAVQEIDSFATEPARFANAARDFERIAERFRVALDSIRESLEQLTMPDAQAAIAELGAEFRELRQAFG